MGYNDNRRSNKMRQRTRQKKLKERIARRRIRLRQERESVVAAAPVKKRATHPKVVKEHKEPKAAVETAAEAPAEPAAEPAADPAAPQSE